jgi:hypothetical protein
MFEAFKLKRSIKLKELEYQQQSLEFATKTMTDITNATRIVQDEDDAQWIVSGSGDGGRPDEKEHLDMTEQAFKMWRTNLQARAIIRNMVKFVIGRGTIVKPKTKADEKPNKKAEEYWKRFQYEGEPESTMVKNKWNLREKEIFTRLFRDGEFILRKFIAGQDEKGLVKIRFIRPNRIQTPTNFESHNKNETVSYGIGHNPEDIEDLKTYYLVRSDGTLQKKIPAEEIIHYKIFADSDMKRGISLLEVCAPMIQKYEGWMEDRITLNKVRTAIALIRKIDAPTARIQAIRDSMESETTTADRKKQKMLERGTVITASKGVEYEMLSPNIHAQDVKDDGRNMLLSVAAGVGFPEMILTADYANANYSSTLIAQNPFVREIEDWQDYAKTFYQELYATIILAGIEFGDLPKGTSTECDVEFPPMVHADIKQENEAYEIMNTNRVMSRKTWQLKQGLEPEIEKANIEQEMAGEVYPGDEDPFKLQPSDDEEDEEKQIGKALSVIG